MLVGNHVVFIFGVERLVSRWDVDFFERQFVAGVVFKQVGVVGGVVVDVGVG